MVESKLVELVVAGSNPVGHPTFFFRELDVFLRPQLNDGGNSSRKDPAYLGEPGRGK